MGELDDRSNRRCWHCGGSGVRCCEFAADRPPGDEPAAGVERAFRVTESPGRRFTLATADGAVQVERMTPDTIDARVIGGGSGAGVQIVDDAALSLLGGLAGLLGAEVRDRRVEPISPTELADIARRWIRDAAVAYTETPRWRHIRRRAIERELRAAHAMLGDAAELRDELAASDVRNELAASEQSHHEEAVTDCCDAGTRFYPEPCPWHGGNGNEGGPR